MFVLKPLGMKPINPMILKSKNKDCTYSITIKYTIRSKHK